MAIKFVVLAALIAVASAQYHGGYHHAAPVYHHSAPVLKVAVADHDHHAPAHYQFAYSVHDSHTHDIKEQHESRNGDKVEGYYSLLEADGTTRIVHYTADKHNGFNAVVERKGHASHPQHVAHKVVAPIAHKVLAAPVHHAPLISHASHHAPLISHGSHHAPAVSFSQHSALSHHAAPVAVKAIAAPVHAYSAPLVAAPIHSGHGHATSHISFSSAPVHHNAHHY